MNIKFEKDGVTKETHEKFTADLLAVGWVVVKDKPAPKVFEEKTLEKPVKKKTSRKGK